VAHKLRNDYANGRLPVGALHEKGAVTVSILGWIIVGGLAGWLASMVMGTNERQGCMMDVILGVIGACVAGWLFAIFTRGEIRLGVNIPSIFIAFVGACVVIGIKKAMSGRNVG
jgi:uncharacterized membrane protein YeaQ/YmgE (transglycosylase-associated protein family)